LAFSIFIVERLVFEFAVSPQPHSGFVNSYAREPGTEPRIMSKLAKFIEAFEHGVLHYLFRVRCDPDN